MPDGGLKSVEFVSITLEQAYATAYFWGGGSMHRSFKYQNTFADVLRIAACISVIALLSAPFGSAHAYTKTTLHNFCAWANCADGSGPTEGLLLDQSGNLYGTTSRGGKHHKGVVFKLAMVSGKWKYSVLHNFCAALYCTDGDDPNGDLIEDVDGNLYGTTFVGGDHNDGAVYKLTHDINGWHFSVLYDFCGNGDCSGGADPNHGFSYAGAASGAPWDESSPLFGTSAAGGVYGLGNVYILIPSPFSWTEGTVHNFKTATSPNALVQNAVGDIYGTTGGGGKYGGGIMYKLAHDTWSETVLHNFCVDSPYCTDGVSPWGRLLIDGSGNLFGTTDQGGAVGRGAAFERTSGGTYKVIHDFCTDCSEGYAPEAGMIMDDSGNLYGTTSAGGNGYNGGAIFKLTHPNWAVSVVRTFCKVKNCSDGGPPSGPVVLNAAGQLFGATIGVGANNAGTVFVLTP